MFWITTIFICLVSLNITSESKYYQRVRYGRDAKDGEFPFVVTLFTVNEFNKVERLCTGSIIARDWVLTAAHCMIYQTPQSVHIWHSNFTTQHLVRKLFVNVKNIFIHSAYFGSDINDETYNDLSLLRTGKLAEHKVGRLLAVDHLTMIGMSVTYVGSGGTDGTKPGHDSMRPLQVGEAGIGPCSNEDTHLKYVICLVPKCDNKIQVPWYGDSGGPLLYAGRIIGVCSYGDSVTEMKNEAYAAISPHLNWIYDTMQKNIDPTTPPVTDAS